MPVLAKPPNIDLSKGFTVPQVAEKHACHKEGVMQLSRNGQIIEKPSDAIKSPYILDFLGLPESEKPHESRIKQAIIDNIQSFLLELGKTSRLPGD